MRDDGDTVTRIAPRDDPRGTIGEGDHFAGGVDKHPQTLVVGSLLLEVRIVQVMDGENEGYGQHGNKLAKLIGRAMLKSEMDVHEIYVARLMPVGRFQRRVRPPVAVNIRVRQELDAGRLNRLGIDVSGGNGKDVHPHRLSTRVGTHALARACEHQTNINVSAHIGTICLGGIYIGAMILTVVGNCQAESLRTLLSTTGVFESERIPPVHELTAADMGWFGELIARTDVLVTQPIRNDYRGLPVGTAQTLAQLPPGARHVVVPVLRFDGPTPYHAIIRDPADSALDPPVVPYHDLRILCAAARGLSSPVAHRPQPDAYRRAAAMSIDHIRTRENHYGAVAVSDYLETIPVWHTLNHPDNATMAYVAEQILRALGIRGEVTMPDYEMLGGLDAPIDPDAAAALGLTVAGRDQWTWREGGPVAWDEIVAAQLAHYRARPALVAHGLERHAERIANLELMETP